MLFTPQPLRCSGKESWRWCFELLLFPFKIFFRITQLVFWSLVLSSFHLVHFLVKSIRPPCSRKINPQLFSFPTRPPLFFSEPESVIEYPSFSCEAFAFFPQWSQPVFSLQDIRRFPFKVAFVFPPSHPFSSWSLTLSRPSISFVRNLFSLS